MGKIQDCVGTDRSSPSLHLFNCIVLGPVVHSSLIFCIVLADSRCIEILNNNFCQKGQDKQCNTFTTGSLIRIFPVCYSDKHFVNSSSDKQHLI